MTKVKQNNIIAEKKQSSSNVDNNKNQKMKKENVNIGNNNNNDDGKKKKNNRSNINKKKSKKHKTTNVKNKENDTITFVQREEKKQHLLKNNSNNNKYNKYDNEEEIAKSETVPHVAHEESTVADISARRATSAHKMTNRQKCLVLGARNMSSKDRHLLLDLRNLMPHAREHAKLGRTHHIAEDLIELCQLHQCNTLLFVEPHRHDVTYMWFAQAPTGPSLKVQIANIHTADEIRMAGNCLKFSRPLLHFDREFEIRPHLRVVKTLLHMIFNTPRYHPKSKPFVDRIMSFFWLDNHIWVRNYQIVPTSPPSLLEIGPRFTLEPVAIFNGCCRGNVLWRNSNALPPTEQRRTRKLNKLEKMQHNEQVRLLSEKHRALHPTPATDPLDLIFRN